MRNRAVILVFCVIILMPALLIAFEGASRIELSVSLNKMFDGFPESEANWQLPTLDAESVVDGLYQEELNSALCNVIPGRTQSLLLTALIQRGFIRASNLLYGWDCYPTYYGSSYVQSSATGALSQLPDESHRMMADRLKAFARTIDSWALAHPDKRIVVYVVDGSLTSSANPAAKLLSSHFTTKDAVRLLVEECSESGISILSDPIDNEAEYSAMFYRSDHHWRMSGAIQAFNHIQLELGNPPWPSPSYCRIEGPPFSGSFARSGLCVVNDCPVDIVADFRQIKLLRNRVEYPGDDHFAYYDSPYLDKRWNLYDLYYLYYDRIEGLGQDNAVLVSDSYGYPVYRLLGTCYRTVRCSKAPRIVDYTTDWLDGMIIEDDAQDIIFIANVENYSNFLDRNPLLLSIK